MNLAPDDVLRLALVVAVALAALTLVLMVQVLVLSELSNRQLQLRRRFDAVWRPRLALASVADHPVAHSDAPRPGEALWFLLLWNRTQRQLRGAARVRLNAMLREFCLDAHALALLQGRDVRARLAALETLRHLGDPGHWPQVEPLLAEPHPVVSLAVAETLVAMDPGRAMAVLLPMARTRQEWTAQRLAGLCLHAGPAAVTPALLRELDRGGEGQSRMLALLEWAEPARVAGWSRSALELRGDPLQRRAALQSLGELGDPHDRPRMIAALTDEDPDTRLAAVRALRRQAVPSDEDVLLPLLSDRSWWVRQEAANAIVALPGTDAGRVRALLPRIADRYGQDALLRALAERAA